MPYLKAGITVAVTTWENDADNYVTKTLSGMSKECAIAVHNFCKLFVSKNGWKEKGFGNFDTSDLDYDEVSIKLTATDLLLIEAELNSSVEDLFDNLIGTWCDGEYVRVFDNIKFLDVPTDIEEIELV
jgi:hypothetical protein